MSNGVPNNQWSYLIMDGNMGHADVVGTNDFKVAQAAAVEDTNCVIIVATCQRLVVDQGVGNPDCYNIEEQKIYKFD